MGMGLMIAKLRKFGSDESGLAMILVSIMLPVLIGFALLVIDGSRAGNLHNDTQRGADALAMAAAAELDTRPDAWTRAERAMANLVDNNTRFSDGGTVALATGIATTINPSSSACRSSGNISWCFLEDIPASDASPITSANYAADPAGTTFIQVTVTPQGFTTIFPASFLGGANTMTIGSEAVAGFAGTVVCEMTPLFICNPFEGSGTPLHEIVSAENFYRKGIRLVAKGGTGQWGPGNFGFLRPSDDHGYGTPELAADIARDQVRECVNNRGLFTRTGVPKPAVEDAINVRFDIYNGQMSSTDPTIPPARNVRKGYKYKNPNNPNVCNIEPATGADLANFRQMTQDSDIIADTTGTLRVGNGAWDYEGYVTANNLGSALAGFTHADGSAYTNANPPSRYDLYRYEVENNIMPVQSIGGERGTPACHASVSTNPNRRLIYGAVVNCQEQEANLNGQSGAPIQAVGYASFFLTEPVGTRTGGDVWAEIVDIDGNKGRGTMIDFARDEVQLYR